MTKPLVLTGQLYWGEATGWEKANAEQKLVQFINEFNRYGDLIGLNWWHLAGSKTMSPAMASMLADARLNTRFNTGEGEV